jgi:hypothetical protein
MGESVLGFQRLAKGRRNWTHRDGTDFFHFLELLAIDRIVHIPWHLSMRADALVGSPSSNSNAPWLHSEIQDGKEKSIARVRFGVK